MQRSLIAAFVLVVWINEINSTPVPNPHLKRRKRAIFATDRQSRWRNNEIPYCFDGKTNWRTSGVEIVIAELQKMTCITFKEVDCNSKEYKLIIYGGSECSAVIGYSEHLSSSIGQKLSLGASCTELGTIRHEMMHVLGAYHMHQSYNRDNSVQVHYDNVQNDVINQFKRVRETVANYFGGGTYDENSVTTYGSESFAKSKGKITITGSESPTRNFRFSFSDLSSTNTAYNCYSVRQHCNKMCYSSSFLGNNFLDDECNCITSSSYYFKNSINNPGWPPNYLSGYTSLKSSYKSITPESLSERAVSVLRNMILNNYDVYLVESDIPGTKYLPYAGKSFTKNKEKNVMTYYSPGDNAFVTIYNTSKIPDGLYVGSFYIPRKTVKDGGEGSFISWIDNYYRFCVTLRRLNYIPNVVGTIRYSDSYSLSGNKK